MEFAVKFASIVKNTLYSYEITFVTHPSMQIPSMMICELGFTFLYVEYGMQVKGNLHLFT